MEGKVNASKKNLNFFFNKERNKIIKEGKGLDEIETSYKEQIGKVHQGKNKKAFNFAQIYILTFF